MKFRNWSPQKKGAVLAAGVAVLIALAISLPLALRSGNSSTTSMINKLPHMSPVRPTAYLTDRHHPLPTNAWFSGLVFARPSSPAYAYPWVLATTNSGASLGYPAVKSTPNTVFADDFSDLKLGIVGANQSRLISFDDMSVVLGYYSGSRQVGNLRLTHGSPYIFVHLAAGGRATLISSGQISKLSSNRYLIKLGGKQYGLWLDPNTHASQAPGGLAVSATKKEPANFTLIALGGIDQATAFKLAANRVTGAGFSYQLSSAQATTRFTLSTSNDQPTLLGLLPHQYDNLPKLASIGTISTLLGTQKFVAGRQFAYSLKATPPSDKIITGKLSADQTGKLKELVNQGISSQTFNKTDSYFAGKQLYRAANLLELAHELDMPKAAGKIQGELEGQLDLWLDPSGCTQRQQKCYYYNPAIGGIVGEQASFGSAKFNDHEFHYGYFIYAASVLGRYDRSFVSRHQTMVDLLVSDIASSSKSQYFPKLRSFDAYAGHSWDDGFGLTNDGNNQESSSEAVNAWYAIYLWSQVTHDQAMAGLARWLYANETNAALTYWTAFDRSAPQYQGYQAPIVSLVWGGKLDYATYFSDSPAAKLGIQLIPMSPGQIYLAKNPTRILQNLTAAQASPPSQFEDYLTMYQALANPDQAKAQFGKITAHDVDDADSLAYLYAWIFGHATAQKS